ncbi:MAG: PIN domain-containing protein [Gemmatimonadetes bacterium]|nr:PIN domain-containing protein [Gemmatimonadota bacterium]MXX34096.1 PIN domain-containing protein [Gemmatimonadota bacterium]MYA12257.1 PIN domain-containing protein [Gemmatimonadota bacterium]MYD14709.1 PIN domain-containing protein [Gemmatimonadota bacterium]MYE71084.1 PIN domain-containing protein [Gemmatimonadota bacterium]
MTKLLDVNVLVALAWPNHVHHAAAHHWFRANRDGGWATCPLTESGFVRISSNRRAIPEACAPRDAIRLLERIRAVEGHVFWTDDISPVDPLWTPFARVAGYRQVTDAHLLALAIRHGGQLATFDRRLAELGAGDCQDVLEVVGIE